MSKLTTRLTAMLLSCMLVIGSAPGAVLAADAQEDPEEILWYEEAVGEVLTEEAAEEISESEGPVADSDGSADETAEEVISVDAAYEGDGSSEGDPGLYEDGPGDADKESGTSDYIEDASGSGSTDFTKDASGSGSTDYTEDASGFGSIDSSDVSGSGSTDFTEDVSGSGSTDFTDESGSEPIDYSDVTGQEQPIPFGQSYRIGDTVITLTAEAGVFPEGEEPVIDGLQDEWLLQQAEEAALPNESRVIFSHAMYSMTGTSMNGTAHVLMENCGLAGLRAEYPDAESVESLVYRWDAETGEIIDTGAQIDADADFAEFDLPELCVFDLVTVIVLPGEDGTEDSMEEGMEETEEGTEALDNEGGLDGLDPALTNDGGDTIVIPDAESETDLFDNADGTEMPETSDSAEGSDIPVLEDSADEYEITDAVDSTDGAEVSDVVDVSDTVDHTTTSPAAGEKDNTGDQHPATADTSGAADAKAEAKGIDSTDPELSSAPSDKKTPGASQEIAESEEEETDAEERRNANSESGVWGECVWEITDGTLTVRPGERGNVGAEQEDMDYSPWEEHNDLITKVVFKEGNGKKVKFPANSLCLFNDLYKVESIDFSGCDTSGVKDMQTMFFGCSSLKSLDVSGWVTSQVNNMTAMFDGCSGLTSIDVSGWNTSSVKNMNSMFDGCSSLKSLDVSTWNTKSVENMFYMFSGCSSLESLDVSGWDTESVQNMTYMFRDCRSLTSLDVSKWNTKSVIGMSYMFYGCSGLKSLDVSGWDISQVGYMNYMFSGCSGITYLDVSNWDTKSVEQITEMFYGCSSLKSLDVSGWNTSKVKIMDELFNGCTSLARITVGSAYTIKSGDMFPDSTASGDHEGKWFSCTDNNWYAKNHIVDNRTNIVDTYVNIPPLKVTKSVTISGGNTDISDKDFEFTVTQKDGNETLYYDTDGNAISTDSAAEIQEKGIHKIKDGNSVWFFGLDPGTYTITELGTEEGGSAQIDGYALTAGVSGDAVVSVDNTAEVTLSNKYTKILTVTSEGCEVTYDGQPHSITVKPEISSATGVTIYYAEEELSLDNYDTIGKTKNPTFTNVISSHDIYFYVDAPDYVPKPQSGKQTVTIQKAASTCTAPKAKTGLVYSGKAQTLVTVTAGSASGGTMQYSLKKDGTFGTSLPTGTNAGTYTVYYKVKGDENHNDTSVMGPVNVSIGKAASTVTAPEAETGLTYSGKAQTLITAGSASGGTLQYSLKKDGTFGTSLPTGTNAGTYTVYYKVKGDGNHNDTSVMDPVSVSIGKKASTSTAPKAKTGLVYSGKAQALITAGSTSDGTLQYSLKKDGTFGASLPTGTDPGTYTVYYKVKGDRNHKDSAVMGPVSVSVGKAASACTAPKAKTGLVYSGKSQTLITAGSTSDGTLQYSLKKDGTFGTSLTTGKNTGTYTVYYKVKGDKNHNDSAVMGPVSVSIAKATSTCTAPKAKTGLVYSGKSQTLITAGSTSDGTLQYSLKKDGTFGTSLPTGKNAGIYTVYYKVKGDKNHKDSAVMGPVSVSIGKAQITITAQDKKSAKWASLKKLTYKVTGAYVSGDKLGIKLSTTAKKSSRAGKYAISVSWNKNKNYKATLKKGTYTITDRMTAPERSRARTRLNAGFKAGWNGSALQVNWGKVEDADLYEIRAAYCGKEMKTVRTIKGNGVTSFKITKIDGKKIDLTNNIKVRVYAYRKVNGKLTPLSSTLVAHVTGGRGRTAAYTNAKKVTVTKNSYTLGTGKTAKIQATAVLNNPAKEQLSDKHCVEFRYISDNRSVATVEEDGTITAAGSGTCHIYVYARNGVHTMVTVTVE